MKNRIEEKLKYLYEMQEKYRKLNNATKGQYQWRQNAIEEQIGVLESILENRPNDEWNECYEEDSRGK